MKFHLRALWGDVSENGDVSYWLDDIEGNKVVFNQFVGKKITITDLKDNRCRICGEKADRLYQKGACAKCFKESPRCDICMIKPELCHFERGTCRDEEFAKEWCFNDQYVYFSITNDLKVGYMSKGNKPGRWKDQGATKAIILANLPTRKMAGDLEKQISEFEKDKTNWSKMLKGEFIDSDLVAVKHKWVKRLEEKWGKYLVADDKVWELSYPVIKYPKKISTISLADRPVISEVLYGIRGQYLLFKDKVFSIKNHEGYMIEIETEEAKEKDLLEQASLF